MKALKALGAGLLALSLASSAQATTVIHISGSSAFRKAVHQAIQDILNPGYTYAYTGSNISGASAANFTGTTKTGGYAVTIQTAFSGSVGGVATVSQQVAPTFGFLNINDAQLSGTGQGGYVAATIDSLGHITNNDQNEFDIPEVCMTDAFQASTPFGSAAAAPYTAQDLVENSVGVVQFKWVANASSPTASVASVSLTTTAGSTSATVSSTNGLVIGAVATGNSNLPSGAYISAIAGTTVTLSATATASASSVPTTFTYAGLSNMTPELAQTLFEAGQVPVAMFTGSGYDRTKTYISTTGTSAAQVWAIGRDADSGTRIGAFADTGVGTQTVVSQYCPLDANNNIIGISGTNIIAKQEFYPAETLNGISYDTANTGYNSGGNLAVAMKATGSLAALGGYYVTYLGVNDAVTALSGGAHEMTYNGVAYSDAAVEEGQYTFWGYEHLDYLQSYSGVGLTVANQIRDQIANVEASLSGIPLSAMHVQRNADGGVITSLY